MSKELTASEALFGFCGWITTRDKVVTAGSTENAAVWADLVKKFCDTNNLTEPSENFTDNLTFPED